MATGAPTSQYLATANETCTFGRGAKLHSIVVGTAAASATVTVYDGLSTSGKVRALIDGNVVESHLFGGAIFPEGIHVVLAGGNAKVTVNAD